jgi:hypothetical protein
MIRIDLSKLDKYEIKIPSKYQDILYKGENLGKVKRVEHIKEKEKGKVYTEFADISDEKQGINVYDYVTEIREIYDEKGNLVEHYVERKDFVEKTYDTVYLYPAFPDTDGLSTTHDLINRWTSGLTLNKWDEMSWSASQTVGEVVFCGNIPSKALTVVAERKSETMIPLKNAVTIEEYSLPITDMPPPPNRFPFKKAKRSSDKAILNTLDEYVNIYDAKGDKLSTINKRGKNFINYLNDGIIESQTDNGVDKYVVVAHTSHEIYREIDEQNKTDNAILYTILGEDVAI